MVERVLVMSITAGDTVIAVEFVPGGAVNVR
jgi:hypothetical protein